MMKLKSVKSIMNLRAKLPRLKALPKRSKKQLDNDKRLGKMSKARAKKKRVKKRRRR